MALKIKRILITQPKPETDKSPYFDLAKKLKLQLEFKNFTTILPYTSKEFRQEKISILQHTAIIFNSKNMVDLFFNLIKELRLEMPSEMKYFCVNEGTALYIQKYIQLRKRKVFYGKSTEKDMLSVLKSHADENYLYLCSDLRKPEVPNFLKKNKIKFKEGIVCYTKSSDLKEMDLNSYDLIAFFSAAAVKSVKDNFPKFKQAEMIIAAFGEATAKAAKDVKLVVSVNAPTPDCPSMSMALEQFITKNNKEAAKEK
ncbi:MAG: uroporphyrinogen-III synthase [Bacteroidetes bacterium]|nr:uroporphyrinogen-III synthase [Bacteroidota bacterium]